MMAGDIISTEYQQELERQGYSPLMASICDSAKSLRGDVALLFVGFGKSFVSGAARMAAKNAGREIAAEGLKASRSVR